MKTLADLKKLYLTKAVCFSSQCPLHRVPKKRLNNQHFVTKEFQSFYLSFRLEI